jgi:hypothetical protein
MTKIDTNYTLLHTSQTGRSSELTTEKPECFEDSFPDLKLSPLVQLRNELSRHCYQVRSRLKSQEDFGLSKV